MQTEVQAGTARQQSVLQVFNIVLVGPLLACFTTIIAQVGALREN